MRKARPLNMMAAKLSLAQVRAEEALKALLGAPQSQNLASLMAESLEATLGVGVGVALRDIMPLESERWAMLGDRAVVVALEPWGEAMALEMDQGLALAMVDILLGGPGLVEVSRRLTPLEEGVLTFALARVAALASSTWGLSLRVLDFVSPEAALLRLGDGHCVALMAEVSVRGRRGWVRLVLPSRVLQPRPPAPLTLGPREMARLDLVRGQISLALGTCSITRGDLGELARGDVVLLDALPDLAQPGRCLWMKLWPSGILLGRAFFGPQGLVISQMARFLQPPCREGSLMAKDETKAPARGAQEEVLQTSPALLEGLTTTLVAEVARVELTAAALLRLHQGQVLLLGRPPAQAVTLVVDGYAIGRGEPVDVEGEMGLRVVELFDDAKPQRS